VHLLVQAVGVLVALAGLAALLTPEGLKRTFRGVMSSDSWLAVASIGRIVFGTVFWLVAPSTRGPVLVRIVGAAMVAAGLSIPLAGRRRLAPFVDWWIERPNAWIRTIAPLAVLLGILVALAGRPA
jgi:hypothetical protein